MKKKLIEIAPPVKAINRASAQEEIRVICYPPAPLDTEDPGRIWEFAFKYNAYEKLGSFQAVCKLAHEREKVFMDTGKWIGTVDELRSCLFFEQRRRIFQDFNIEAGEKMLKILIIKYSENSEYFTDSAMSDFLADKEVPAFYLTKRNCPVASGRTKY